MTLDEAIYHAKHQATSIKNCKCAADHLQLANWLEHYKELLQKESDTGE